MEAGARMKQICWSAGVVVGTLLFHGHSSLLWAQSAPVAPPGANSTQKAGSEPQATTATFGDWVLRCNRISPSKPERACEAAFVIQRENLGPAGIQLAIGLPTQNGARFVLLMPANVSLTAKPMLKSDARGDVPIEFSWRRCTPLGCIAEASLASADLQRLKPFSGKGQLTLKDASDRNATIQISFNGFGPVLTALEASASR